jgi:hypothetical protein
MHLTPQLKKINAAARRYSVTPRTIYRWLADKVVVSDPCSVALHLSTQKNPAPAAVAAVKNILQNELESLTNS